MDVAGREMGITGVPFFVFNNKVMLSGAQPVEVIIDAINKAKWKKKFKKIKARKNADYYPNE